MEVLHVLLHSIGFLLQWKCQDHRDHHVIRQPQIKNILTFDWGWAGAEPAMTMAVTMDILFANNDDISGCCAGVVRRSYVLRGNE